MRYWSCKVAYRLLKQQRRFRRAKTGKMPIVRRSDGPEGGWCRLDDTSVTPATAAAVLGRARGRTDAAYTLLYRRSEGPACAPPPPLLELPAGLRAAVKADNETYRRERLGRTSCVVAASQDSRPPSGAGCGGGIGQSGLRYVC